MFDTSQSYLIFFFLGYTPNHFQVNTKFSTAIIVNNNGFDAKYQNDDDVNLVPAEQKQRDTLRTSYITVLVSILCDL